VGFKPLKLRSLSAERDNTRQKRRTTQLKLGDTERRTRKIAILHRSKSEPVSILATQVTRQKAPNATDEVLSGSLFLIMLGGVFTLLSYGQQHSASC